METAPRMECSLVVETKEIGWPGERRPELTATFSQRINGELVEVGVVLRGAIKEFFEQQMQTFDRAAGRLAKGEPL